MFDARGLKVFVWISYGDARVYDIATKESYDRVLQELKTLLVESFSIEKKGLKTIQDCIDALGGVGKSDTFEYGTGIQTIQ
jgi:hypothetical protein